MAKTGQIVTTLLVGTIIGAAAGYLLATDNEKRQEQIDALKSKLRKLKSKMSQKTADIEDEIYNA